MNRALDAAAQNRGDLRRADTLMPVIYPERQGMTKALRQIRQRHLQGLAGLDGHAQAVEDVAVIEIPRSFFVRKIEEDSLFALRMLGAIAARQHYLVQQLEQVTTRTAPQRIGAFLVRFCKKEKQGGKGWMVDLPYDKSIISRRLNIKPETFSRALAKLEPHGVSLIGRDIWITDMAKLIEFCDLSPQEVPC